jgi:hypothetical protein
VAAEGSLQNLSTVSAIEERTPLLQLAHSLRGFLSVELGHAPVVQELSPAHRIAKVRTPVVRRIYVRHRGRDAPLSHHRMRFAKQ